MIWIISTALTTFLVLIILGIAKHTINKQDIQPEDIQLLMDLKRIQIWQQIKGDKK